MKIAVNTRLLQPNKMDGIGVFTHEIFKRITKNHPEHQFVFLFDQPFDKNFIYSNNIEGKTILPPTKHPLLYKLWFQYALPQALNKLKPDVFISPDGNLPLNLIGKTINVIHDLNFEHYPQFLPKQWQTYYRKNFPLFAQKADKIITVSNYSKQDIITTYMQPASKVEVVYNGVSDFFAPVSLQEKNKTQQHYTSGQPYFIFVGSLHPRKNIIGLLQAFEHFKKQHQTPHKLVLAGKKMWWTNEMQQTLSALKYKKDVVFTRRVTNNQLNNLLASAEALTYVPHFEGFGIPVLEAFKCEVPVICSNNSSLPEVAGEAAILVDNNNTKALSDAMWKIVNDNELKNNLINKGKERLQQFSWDKSAEKFWQIIEQVTKQ